MAVEEEFYSFAFDFSYVLFGSPLSNAQKKEPRKKFRVTFIFASDATCPVDSLSVVDARND